MRVFPRIDCAGGKIKLGLTMWHVVHHFDFEALYRIITPAVGENPKASPKSQKFFLSNVRSSNVLLSLVHRH